MGKKLFGNSASGGRFSGSGKSKQTAPRREEKAEPVKEKLEEREAPAARTRRQPRKAKKRGGRKAVITILVIVLCLEILYCVAVFSNIPFIKRLRTAYIQTAMTTMSHHWLAEAFIPHDIIREVMVEYGNAREGQMGMTSNWGTTPTEPKPTVPTVPTEPETTPTETVPQETEPETLPGEEEFYELFWEIDRDSMEEYIEKNPDTLDNGWEGIYINEAGLDDDGTSIQTIEGDQVLAVDAPNQIILIRVTGTGYRGVLALAKKQENLHLCLSKGLWSYGEHAGEIAEANDGVLAVTASGFLDPDGGGNGGQLAGYCMSDGEGHGYHYGWGYKRLELHEDNRFYITDAYDYVSDGTTDAVEFWPAMILDGEIIVNSAWGGIQPRCSVGQTRDEEFMFLVIEGRRTDSLGTDVQECSEIMARYNCYQAMNMDGGTSAIMWYDGEYVTRCSNVNTPEGRYLPNAWVYTR